LISGGFLGISGLKKRRPEVQKTLTAVSGVKKEGKNPDWDKRFNIACLYFIILCS
jgi:hypothetical protein